ncbi:hypothetical protein D3C72_791900 [compost metagenome]
MAHRRAVDLTGDTLLRRADVVDGDGHEVPENVSGRSLRPVSGALVAHAATPGNLDSLRHRGPCR